MILPFKCTSCSKEFKKLDEQVVTCPVCKSTDVKVQWDEIKKEV